MVQKVGTRLKCYTECTRWVEKQDFKLELIDYQPGEEAGIKDVTFEIRGDYSFGLLKSEAGVHRMVRLSPFDSNNRRHTSFASVFIYPSADDNIDIQIEQSDIGIDAYGLVAQAGNT